MARDIFASSVAVERFLNCDWPHHAIELIANRRYENVEG